MLHRLGLAVALIAVVAVSAGCTFGSKMLGSVSGCDVCRNSTGSQACSYARSWSRAMNNQQQFIDEYFLLYDVNDPYRCDCPIYDYCPCGSCGCYPFDHRTSCTCP
jgi:hypothetical protein